MRRALMTQKAYAEGLRALYPTPPPIRIRPRPWWLRRRRRPGRADQRPAVADRQGVGSERAYQTLTESLQTYGGSGFLQDYPVEQYIRDAKIDSLYEGTTAIQAQDFFFRKIARDQGVALSHLVAQIEKFIDSPDGRPELAASREQLADALDNARAMVAAMTGYLFGAQEDARELYRVGLDSVAFLLAVGDLLIGWLLLRQAEIALTALVGDPDPRERAFYSGGSRSRTSSSATCCPDSPPSGASPKLSTWQSWTSARTRSEPPPG